MNKKTIIEIVIIVGAFVGAGVVLYNGLFKGNSQSEGTLNQTIVTEKILPYGDTFDYSKIVEIRKKKFQFGAVQYPQVDPKLEVGKDPSTLIYIPPVTIGAAATPGTAK